MDTLQLLFGDQLEFFVKAAWPNRQQCVFAASTALQSELWSADELFDLDALLACHRGWFRTQGYGLDGAYAVSSHFDAATAKMLLDFGVPVQLCDFDLSVPAARRLALGLLNDLGLPASAGLPMVFVSPPGRGVSRHYDAEDTWIIGLKGTKAFWVAPNVSVQNPDRTDVAGDPKRRATMDSAPDMPPDATRFLLGPGDCLFLPRGYWHESAGSDEFSWSLTIGITRQTALDLVLESLAARAARDPRCREPFAGLRHGADSGGMADALSALVEIADELSPATIVDEYELRAVAQRHRRILGAELHLDDATSVATIVQADGCESEVDVPVDAKPLIRSIITASTPLRVHALASQFPDIAVELVASLARVLVQTGFLEPDSFAPHRAGATRE